LSKASKEQTYILLSKGIAQKTVEPQQHKIFALRPQALPGAFSILKLAGHKPPAVEKAARQSMTPQTYNQSIPIQVRKSIPVNHHQRGKK